MHVRFSDHPERFPSRSVMSAPNVRRVPANHQAYLRATLIDIPSQPTVDSFMEQARGHVAASGVVLNTANLFAARNADRR